MKRKKMLWLYLLFVTVHCGADVVSNLTMVIDRNRRLIYCILIEGIPYTDEILDNDDLIDSAIAWKLPIPRPIPPSKYYFGPTPLDCDMNEGDACLKEWTRTGQWQLTNSLFRSEINTNFVFDYRWEKFETIKVEDERVLNATDYPESFELWFSVQTATDIKLQICIKEGGCVLYPILADNQVSAVKYPGSEWTHYILQSNNGSLTIVNWSFLLDNTELFLSNATVSNLTIIGPKQSKALWKPHLNSYIVTTNGTEAQLGPDIYLDRSQPFCLSFYVSMCFGCRMMFKLVNSKNSVIKNITVKSSEWLRVRFFVSYDVLNERGRDSGDNTMYRFLFYGEPNIPGSSWAIDDVRQCEERDIRVSAIIFNKEDLHHYSFYSIRYSTIHFEASAAQNIQRSDWSCPLTTFGPGCIDCNTISDETCGGYAVCNVDDDDNTKCSCTAGFEGPTCEQECQGSYGFDCSQTCGECLDVCFPVKGECWECKSGYYGTTCKNSDLPTLIHPPKINVSYTYLLVQLESAEYSAPIEPMKYFFQYKKDDETWQNSSEYDLEDLTPKYITHLLPDTEYTVRGLLKTSEYGFEEKYVEVQRIRTICAGIAKEDVIILPKSNSVQILIINSTETCHPSYFHLHFKNQIYPLTLYTLTLSPLEAYTEYKFAIESLKTNVSFELHFTTEQAAPKEIDHFRTDVISATSVKLYWIPPRVTYGIIKHYKVFYKHFRYISCYNTVRNKISSGTFETENTTLIIDNLIPFSQYIAHVRAVTIFDGDITQIEFKTLPTDLPNDEEIPQLDLTHGSTYLDVYLREANCDRRYGFLIYTLTLCCKEEWCTCETKNVTSTNRNFTYARFDTHNFSTYFVKVDMQRPNGRPVPQTLGQIFTTAASVPDSVRNLTLVYRTRDKLRLCWLPPLPPSGEIESYLIISCSDGETNREVVNASSLHEFSCIERIFPMKSSYHIKSRCMFDSVFQSISVAAANKERPEEYGPSAEIAIPHALEKPDAPRNFSATWDDYYNLTLTWTHNSVNELLIVFKIKVFGEADRKLETSGKQLYTFNITDAKPSSELFITLTAKNSAGESRTVALVTHSPPETPKFITNPYLLDIGNTWALIIVPKLSQISNDSNLYVVVSEANRFNNTAVENFLKDVLQTTVTNEHNSLWIALELTLGIDSERERQITLGSDDVKYSARLKRNVSNKALKPGMDYIATFLVSNIYHYKTRSNVRTVAFSTAKN